MRIILIRFNLQDYVKSSALQRLIDTLKIQVKKKKKKNGNLSSSNEKRKKFRLKIH